jgi:flagellar basal-body rod protein FlgC
MSLAGAIDISTTGLVAQSLRLNLVATNIANAESVAGPDGMPFRARLPVFQALPTNGRVGRGVAVKGIVESDAEPRLEYRPGHPMADAKGYVTMSNVNPAEQMVDMVSASRSYQMNLDIMNITRQLMLKTMDLGK